MFKGLTESSLKHWIEDSLHNNTHTLAAGYQGKTLLFEDENNRLVIKIPHGSGLVKYIHTLTIRHEYEIYKKLSGFSGCPKCYGLIDNKYLVLAFIDGHPIRKQQPVNHATYFDELFSLIGEMHQLQVTHIDLKKKDNLLVTRDDKPCMIDFGTAVIKKPGFHPLNALLFKLAKRFDYNAWIKQKYHNNMHNLSDEDSIYYRRTFIEKVSSLIKKSYTKALKR